MPELPEVETIKRELIKAILGERIVEGKINNPKVIVSKILFKIT